MESIELRAHCENELDDIDILFLLFIALTASRATSRRKVRQFSKLLQHWLSLLADIIAVMLSTACGMHCTLTAGELGISQNFF